MKTQAPQHLDANTQLVFEVKVAVILTLTEYCLSSNTGTKVSSPQSNFRASASSAVPLLCFTLQKFVKHNLLLN